jgi:hypothetical protein
MKNNLIGSKLDLELAYSVIISLFNDPTAGAQAFFTDYTYGEPAITHHAGPVRVGEYICVFNLLKFSYGRGA